ncbi:hypothetical protein COCCU_05080 [Corynebacterium occultum]|uniref:Uncharacterized protein n=2 Tax=Corynebacterium occultum TaxID=2675219 RepID=A0A6B8VN71_9CORY|nr:hypothetical protein COCCU_05080 [Corynebacterium occultum]
MAQITTRLKVMSILEIAATSPTLPIEDLRTREPASATEILQHAARFFPAETWVKTHPGQHLGSPLALHSSQVVLAAYGPTTMVRSAHARLLPDVGGSFIHLEYNTTSQAVNLEISGAAGNRRIIGSDAHGLGVDTHGEIGQGTPLPFENEFRSLVEHPTAAMWFSEFCTWAFGFPLLGTPLTQTPSIDPATLAFHVITPVPQGTAGAHILGTPALPRPTLSWWQKLRNRF